MVYSTRRFVLMFTRCYFVIVFFSPMSIAITALGEDRTNLRALFVCLFVLRLYGPNGVISSAISLPNHTFTWQV